MLLDERRPYTSKYPESPSSPQPEAARSSLKILFNSTTEEAIWAISLLLE